MEEVKDLVLELLAELDGMTVDGILQFKTAWEEAAVANGSYEFIKPFIDKIVSFELERKTA